MAGKQQENPWSKLSTVTTFDNGNHSWTTRRMDETEVQGGGQIVGRVAPSTSLLIESLIQQLCTMFEGDVMRRNKLYYAICDRLFEMKLIDGSYNKGEFEAMRGQYQVALYKLVAVARALTGSESTLKVPSGPMAEWSRYRREFIELEFIAAGGFGCVYKARHRLDGSVYAIKKITVRSGRVKTIMKHLEEVKTIARLDHTNIVSYKGAWIEQSFPMTFADRYKTKRVKENAVGVTENGTRRVSKNLTNAQRTRTETGKRRYDVTTSGSNGSRRRREIGKYAGGENEDDDYDDDDDDNDDDDDEDDDVNDVDDVRPMSESSGVAYKTGMYPFLNAIRKKRNERGEDCDDCATLEASGRVAGGYVISHDIVNERFQQLNSATTLIGRRVSERLSSRIDEAEEPSADEEISDVVSFRSETRDREDTSDGADPSGTPSPTDEYDFGEYGERSESHGETACSKRELCRFDHAAPQRYAILYIQMALCDQTLRQWLDDRREPTPLHIVTAILTQILSGLEYIHSLGIVHHDIKPSNIFISKSGNLQIQLGDFGLACPLQRAGSHSVHGTPTYAAPEQLNGICDPKSDVYSLGIVLLELLVPMQTSMERSRVITALKQGQVPQVLNASYPQWAQIILQLVQDNPKKRPSPTELLKYLSEDKDSIIARLREDNVRKDNIIRTLQDKIEELEATIKRHKITIDDT